MWLYLVFLEGTNPAPCSGDFRFYLYMDVDTVYNVGGLNDDCARKFSALLLKMS